MKYLARHRTSSHVIARHRTSSHVIARCAGLSNFKRALVAMMLFATTAGWHHLEAQQLDESNALSCDATATYTIANYQGNLVSAQPISVTGFQFNGFSFDPGQGTFTFSDISYTNYRGFGDFEVELTLGGQQVIVSGKVADCCDPIAYDHLFIDEEMLPQTFSGQTVLLFGDIRIPGFTEFNESTVLLGVDAQVILEESTVQSNVSTFDRYCEYPWDQIVLNNSSESLLFSSSTLRESIRGIHTLNDAVTSLQSSTFENNLVSVYVENHTGGGPFNGSYLNMDGCTLDYTRPMNTAVNMYPIHHQSTIAPVDFFPNSCAAFGSPSNNSFVGIYVGYSQDVNIGWETNAINNFEMTVLGDGRAIAAENSKIFVKNNSVDVKYESSVCSNDNSKVNIGGDTPAEGNTLSSSFDLINSSFFIGNNTIGSASTSTHSSLIDKVAYTEPDVGRRKGGEIIHNTFQSRTGYVAKSLFVQHDGTPSYLRIFDNDFDHYSVSVNSFAANSSAGRLVIHSNYSRISGVNYGFGYFLEGVDGATFANNEINGPTTELTVTNNPDITGVQWKNGANAEFYGNEIKFWNYGLTIENSCTNTQFECNTFTNNFFGIYLDHAQISDQGSASKAGGNVFIELFSPGPSPYSWRLTGTASQPVNSTWYQYPDPINGCSGFPTPHAQCLIENLLSVTLIQAPKNGCNNLPVNFKRDPNTINESKATASGNFKVFPNPASDVVQISLAEGSKAAQLSIHNHTGKLYYILENSSKKEISISTDSWPAGVYLVHYGNHTQKLMIK